MDNISPRIDAPILQVKGLVSQFALTDKSILRAVDKVDLNVEHSQVHGVVGESGCGKSATALSILRLLEPQGKISEGSVLWKGVNLIRLSPRDMRKIRGKEIAMVFQNPQASLNPLYTIGNQMISLIKLHRALPKKEAHEEAIQLLDLVRISNSKRCLESYPHQLSGGMCQRVMIAMALSCKPDLLIADEPTAALDVTIQAQIIDLLLDLKERLNMSILLISHEMGVIAKMCDVVSVMYLGKIVEFANVDNLFNSPKHPYTEALLEAVPLPDPSIRKGTKLSGDIPKISEVPQGCNFQTRCPHAFEKCMTEEPVLKTVRGTLSKAACWLYE